MNLIISFSGRANGNCDRIMDYIAGAGDTTVCFRDLKVHECSGCDYECFDGPCRYRDDELYPLFESMDRHDKTFLIVPMYCGNPSSLYFRFSERSQDFFMHNEALAGSIASGTYIIGVYGSRESEPDFVPCLQRWFGDARYSDHVLGVERHRYGLKMADSVLDVAEIRQAVREFIRR